jgi:hypothetical protein
MKQNNEAIDISIPHPALPEETVSECHPEATAEGSRLRKRLKMRDASLRST